MDALELHPPHHVARSLSWAVDLLHTMSLAQTHIMWRDSVPATTFPFRYVDRTHGTITQSWNDIKDKLQRDAMSNALPFCSSHYSPSQLHNLLTVEMNRKHERNAHKLSQLETRLHGAPITPTVNAGRATQVLRPSRPMSADERDLLTNGAGGGRGRQEYLRYRRRLPLQQRTSLRQTTSQQYGWEQLDFSSRDTVENAGGHSVSEFLPVRTGAAVAAQRGAPQEDSAGAASPATPATEAMLIASGLKNCGESRMRSPTQVNRGPAVPGDPGRYYGRRAVLSQLSRPRGVFSGH
jgi:hypothetical protein